MKTLLVLSALATVAIAAPALPEERQEHKIDLDNLQDTITREKKSPAVISTTIEDISDSPPLTDHSETGTTTASERSLNLKKPPLIVKKKHGYHLYRDSDEEKAMSDTHEACGRQIRLKLCDEGKFRDIMRATEPTKEQKTEDDMKTRIKMAKDAVEGLHRDFIIMENTPRSKTKPLDSDQDSELHEDIEVARQALEHIQNHFGNLESMSLHASTSAVSSRDSESMPEVHATLGKTEDERLAQWKQAIQNIQENVEIARNIEDSFKSTMLETTSLADESSDISDTKNHHKTEENTDTHLPMTEDLQLRASEMEKVENQDTRKDIPSNTVIENHIASGVNRNNKIEKSMDMEDDMNGAATTMIETRMDAVPKEDTFITSEDKTKEMQLVHEKNAEPKTQLLQENHSMTMNTDDKINEEKMQMEEVKHLKNAENMFPSEIDPMDSAASTMSFSKSSIDGESPAMHKASSENNLFSDIGPSNMKEADILNPEHTDNESDNPALILEDDFRQVNPKENEDTMKVHGNIEDTNISNAPINSLEHLQNFHHEVNNPLSVRNAVDTLNIPEQLPDAFKMKEAANPEPHNMMKLAETESNLLHKSNEQNSQLPQENFEKLALVKAAEELQSFHSHHLHDQDHFHSVNLDDHHHMHSEIDSTSNFEMPIHGHLHPSRFHHNSMVNKMVDMRNVIHPSFQASMRDPMDGFGSESLMRWSPTHETARAAYGSGMSNNVSPPGAVGVFPNANAGGCGIPLLLSCSPSVVSGSLAKPHPAPTHSYTAPSSSYTAPSYRAEEDFSIHNKRDIKKNNELLTTNVLRMPTPIKQKGKIILDHKI